MIHAGALQASTIRGVDRTAHCAGLAKTAEGKQTFVGQRPGRTQETERSYVLEPEAERRMVGVGTASGDPAQARENRFGQHRDARLGEQCLVYRPTLAFDRQQRSIVSLVKQPRFDDKRLVAMARLCRVVFTSREPPRREAARAVDV
jgi:hypothetical protein